MMDSVSTADLSAYSYLDECQQIWGRPWGAQSEIGKLRYALVSVPTENESVEADMFYTSLGLATPDLQLMREQHQLFVEVLERAGVEIAYLEPPLEAFGPYGRLRMLWAPASAFVINGGAIIPRYGLAPWRRGFEAILARKLGELGCPVLYTIHGDGIFELGGNCQWLDPEHLVIGVGSGMNMDAVVQVWEVFKRAGVKEIYLAPFKGHIHLDLCFGLADLHIALVDTRALDKPFLKHLKRLGFDLIEVPPEEAERAACNTLVLEPGRVVTVAGNPKTRKALERRGVIVHEVEMSEFVKAGGGPHCATSSLIREPGPLLVHI